MSQLATTPAGVQQATVEFIAWGIDMTDILLPGQTPINPVSTFQNLVNKTYITLNYFPTVSGNIVTQIIDGSELKANTTYQLVITFTASPSSNVLASVLTISCPL